MEHVRYFLQFSGEADCHLAGIRRRGAGARVVPRASPVRTSVSWTSGRIRAESYSFALTREVLLAQQTDFDFLHEFFLADFRP